MLPLAAFALFAASVSGADSPLTTVAERSGWKNTGRLDEVVRICHELGARYPERARCSQFGVSPEGRPLLALALSDDGTLTPELAKERHRPVLLAQGGIHAGEIEGKDAGLKLARELLAGRRGGPLAAVTWVFVPVFNVDGHERFGAWNRPNQNGPAEMGWRVTAQNLNLNRDYMKAEAPEMQAMLALLGAWDPVVYVDLHTTDGAQFQHDISISVDPVDRGAPALRKEATRLSEALVGRLKEKHHLPIGEFYPAFVREDDPSSGFARGVAPPRFSHGYWATRGRIGILVETHAWKSYAARAQATFDLLTALFAEAQVHAGEWRKAADAADRGPAAGELVPLAWEPTGHSRSYDFLGYHYTRTASAVSGLLRTRYFPDQPERWQVPLLDTLKAGVEEPRPGAGYVVPAAWAQLVATKLGLHGIVTRTLKNGMTAEVGLYRATSATTKDSFEGRQPLEVKGGWTTARRQLPPGSLFVPIAQPLAVLVMALLEPRAPDSLNAWGYFNAAYERKEYMEPYVTEEVAEKLLADKEVRAAFAAELARDPEFAKSPRRRLDFFSSRHPSFDERWRLYPVYRIERAPL